MDILQYLVASMTKDEARNYKIFSARTATSNDRKDWALFDFIRRQKQQYQDEHAFKLVYGRDTDSENPPRNKNAFYRLKNRLMDDIYKSQILLHFMERDHLQASTFLSLAKLYFDKNEFKIAHYLTQKAEKYAIINEDYELLDLIYSFFIRLSLEIVTVNPSELISARKLNQENLNLLREIDDILASVNYNMKISQNFATHTEGAIFMLQKSIDKLAILPQARQSPKIQIKMYQAYSKLLLQMRDYKGLAEYATLTYLSFEEKGFFNQSTHEIKLSMLTYIVNASFKVNDFQKSLVYSEKLGIAIEEYNRMMYEKYVFFYYNSLVINYSRVDIDKAIALLEELKEKDALKRQPFYEVFIYLNLSIFKYQKKLYKKAIKELTSLYIHESYKNVAPALRQKIASAEMIIRFDMKDYDFVERKCDQIRRDYEELLNESPRELKFIVLMKQIAQWAGLANYKSQIQNPVKSFLELYPESSDADIIAYDEWLKNKIH